MIKRGITMIERLTAVVATALALAAWGCATALPSIAAETDEIRASITAQVEAWNRGDIDASMQGYWRSDKLRYASGDSVSYGWDQIRARYIETYPDRSAMGMLTFSELNVEEIAPNAASVFGRWLLKRDKEELHGLFTLSFRKMTDGWKITADHTSAASR
jgi:ketosteroid isomerase-like protein